MFYVQRDPKGTLIRVETEAFEGGREAQLDEHAEIRAWQESRSAEEAMRTLHNSDQELIRVLEDLIKVLIGKGVISITDLPSAAQAKLVGREQTRESLSGLGRLIDEDDHGLI